MTTLATGPAVSTPLRSRRFAAPLAVGLFGTLVSLAFSWVPSIWFDEAATISATTRSWPELFRMLHSVDAVHGLFYAGMHVWFDLVGYTPFTLRLPSAAAIGLTSALLVVLARRLGHGRAGVFAAIAFALLPRITLIGTEGRSFAVTTTLAVVLTLVFLSAWQRGTARTRWWALYAVVAVVASMTFVYLVFLVAAHGVTAAVVRLRQGRAASGPLIGWSVAAGISIAVMLPFVAVVSRQSAQVNWIPSIGLNTLHGVFVTQYFFANPLAAVSGWGLLVAGCVVLWRRRSRPAASVPLVIPSLTTMVLPWIIVPTLGLIAASVVVSPLYSPRYLGFTAPAAAMLMGVGLAAIARRRTALVAVVVLAAIAAPQYVLQRTPEAKQHSSWSEVASFIGDQRALETGSPDAVIYGPVRQHKTATTRVIEYAYPQAFAGSIDVKLGTPAAQTGGLWETRKAISDVVDRLDGVDTVWLVTSDRQDWRPGVTSQLADLGYHVDGEWAFTGVNVLRYTR